MLIHYLVVALPLVAAEAPGKGSSLPRELRQFNKKVLLRDSYQSLPWEDLALADFYPRQLYNTLPLEQAALSDEAEGDLDDDETPTPAKVEDWTPTKTRNGRGRIVLPRSEFTFSCPTSVQCNDGGYCQIGDYCAIRDGTLGCCVMHPLFPDVGRKSQAQ